MDIVSTISLGQAPVKAGICVLDLLAFIGGACPGDYGTCTSIIIVYGILFCLRFRPTTSTSVCQHKQKHVARGCDTSDNAAASDGQRARGSRKNATKTRRRNVDATTNPTNP